MRNIFCFYYGLCLELAVKKNLNGFSCSGCPHEMNEDGRAETDLRGCWLLLWAIFRPDLYALYRASELTAGRTGREDISETGNNR